jgi:hypothetical protein
MTQAAARLTLCGPLGEGTSLVIEPPLEPS